ncbi:hypothetical protein PanWU01x14_223200 [Parasponia andersonii]|uniref:Uncharacterized protein n=1 Tax=Parasponia andersonii TaxID=3476 RepID=A0A2P5BNT5_PARAD|nr:hypothetical protein PanWU01x14_223200 [Parasponia andersonii]
MTLAGFWFPNTGSDSSSILASKKLVTAQEEDPPIPTTTLFSFNTDSTFRLSLPSNPQAPPSFSSPSSSSCALPSSSRKLSPFSYSRTQKNDDSDLIV